MGLDNLLDNLLNIVNDVLTGEVQGWKRTLQRLADHLKQATTDALDRCWDEQQSILVRRIIPERHSQLEERVHQHIVETFRQRVSVTATDVESHAEPLARAIRWGVGFNPQQGQDTMKIKMDGFLPAASLQLTDLLAYLERQYTSVAGISIGDVLDLASTDSETFIRDLAATIKAKTTLLASPAPQPTKPPNQLPIPHTFLFGPWGSSQRSIRELRQALIDQGFDEADFCDTLGQVPAATGVPLKQAIWVLRTHHGVSLAGFGTAEALETRYLRLRSGEKPLHIFPEERAAAEIENEADELVRAGRLRSHVRLLDAEAVLLARDGRLMRNILLLAADGQLRWQFDPRERVGEWTLSHKGQSYCVARGTQPKILLDTLVQLTLGDTDERGDAILQRLKEVIDKAAGKVAYPYSHAVRNQLEILAKDGPSEIFPLQLKPGNELLVRVVALKLRASAKSVR